MIVWSRVKLTSPPPAAAMSKSVSHISSAPSSGSPSARKELCVSATRYIEFQRLLVMAAHLDRNVLLGNFRHGGVHGRPFAARAAINALADGCKQLFRPAAQGLFDDSVSLCFPQF